MLRLACYPTLRRRGTTSNMPTDSSTPTLRTSMTCSVAAGVSMARTGQGPGSPIEPSRSSQNLSIFANHERHQGQAHYQYANISHSGAGDQHNGPVLNLKIYVSLVSKTSRAIRRVPMPRPLRSGEPASRSQGHRRRHPAVEPDMCTKSGHPTAAIGTIDNDASVSALPLPATLPASAAACDGTSPVLPSGDDAPSRP